MSGARDPWAMFEQVQAPTQNDPWAAFEPVEGGGQSFVSSDGAVTNDPAVAARWRKEDEARVGNTPSTGQSFTRGLGLGVRDAIQGLGQLPGMVVDAVNAPVNLGIRGVNAVAGTEIPQIPPVASTLSGAADAMGLPTPTTRGEKVRSAIGQNVAGIIPSMGAGAALQGVKGGQFLGNALTAAPTSQLAGAAGAGAAGEMAGQAEWGPAQQFGAALAGGVAGASMPMLAGGAVRGIAAAGQPFTEGGRRKIIGEALLRNSSDPPSLPTRLVDGADDATRRLPGSPVTSGVAARDPQMMILEAGLRSDVQAPPSGMSPAAAIRDVEAVRNANRLATAQALQRGTADVGARGAEVRGAIRESEKAMKALTNKMYREAATGEKFPVAPILGKLKEVETRYFGKLSGGMPSDLSAVADDLKVLLKPPPPSERWTPPAINLTATPITPPPQVPPTTASVDWDALQNLYSRIGKIVGQAQSGSTKDARVVAAGRELRALIDDLGSTPQWQAAKAQRAAQGAAVGRDATGANAVGRMLQKDDFGAPILPDSRVPSAAIADVASAKQTLGALEKGIRDGIAAGIPDEQIFALNAQYTSARQTLRDQFAENLTRASSTTGDIVDASGKSSRLLSPAQFTRWWEQNKKVADVLFDATERRTLDRLAADFAETSITGTARARGSDTAQNLSVGNFIARLTNGVIDPQNPLAQSLGRLGPIADWIVRSPEQAMREMLTQAIRDPKFAAELVKGAGPDSLERAVLYWQQTMPQRVRDAAMGAGVRATPRIGLEPPKSSQTPMPALPGR
jgi:hypothetical protein